MNSKHIHASDKGWDTVSSWYDTYLESRSDTYQEHVIAPNLLRLLRIQKGQSVLDLACGQGYFSRLVAKEGAKVIGIDNSKELIAKAQEYGDNVAISQADTTFIYAQAQATMLEDHSFSTIFTVLAFENIKHIDEVVQEISRLLKEKGSFFLVLLHPAFRIPQHSDWKYDEKNSIQYRRTDKYLSELSLQIDHAPFSSAQKKKTTTTTYHRSIQWYMKVFKKYGFGIVTIEEWISHKKSQPGPRQHAEDTPRKEFPLFLALEFKQF